MSDTEIKKGDICIYHKAGCNGSLALVAVTDIYDKYRCKIKCLQVFIDNSDNDWVRYLLKTGGEMTASNEYLHRLDNISCQQAVINRQREEIAKLKSDVQILLDNSSRRTEVYQYIKTQAFKEIAEILKGIVENDLCLTENETDYLCMRIDDEAKRLVGDDNA